MKKVVKFGGSSLAIFILHFGIIQLRQILL